MPNPSILSFSVIEGKHDSLEEIELGVLVWFSRSAAGLLEENLKNVAISVSPWRLIIGSDNLIDF